MNMSSKQIQIWISSDEINVTVEEDVFNIITAWIDHEKSKRKKFLLSYFVKFDWFMYRVTFSTVIS